MKFLKILKRDIDSKLLFLVIFLLILLAGFNIYHQEIINDLSLDCSAKYEQLTEITGRLSLEQTKSNSIAMLQDATEKDKEFLEKDFMELTGENKVLKNIAEKKKDVKNGIGSCKSSGTAECP